MNALKLGMLTVHVLLWASSFVVHKTPSKLQPPGLSYGVLISCFLTLPKLLILWTDHLELHTIMNFSRLW